MASEVGGSAAKGLPVDVALQRAKKDFIASGSKETRLPYYWSGAVLVGETEALVGPGKRSGSYVSIVIALLTVIGSLILFRWRVKSKVKRVKNKEN